MVKCYRIGCRDVLFYKRWRNASTTPEYYLFSWQGIRIQRRILQYGANRSVMPGLGCPCHIVWEEEAGDRGGRQEALAGFSGHVWVRSRHSERLSHDAEKTKERNVACCFQEEEEGACKRVHPVSCLSVCLSVCLSHSMTEFAGTYSSLKSLVQTLFWGLCI